MLRLLTITFVAAWLTCISAEQRSLKVHITTWNVNSQNPPENIDKLLGQDENDTPDIVVLGLQEVTMNPKQAILDYLFRDEWSKKLEATLESKDYKKIKTKTVVSVALMVYIKKDLKKSVSEIDALHVATGFGGFYGNKGAVIINFRLLGKRFGFVSCHLPANDGEVKSRIEHINLIEEQRTFHPKPGRLVTLVRTKEGAVQFLQTRGIIPGDCLLEAGTREGVINEDVVRKIHKDGHIACREKATWMKLDYLFLLGDLNFRVSESNWDAETISNMIRKGLVKEVLEKDELKQLMADGTVFKGWNEAEINFKPTFKVLVGDGSYNLKRRPAWTDRVIFKSETGQEIVNKAYDSVDGFLESDHKPVIANFELPMEA